VTAKQALQNGFSGPMLRSTGIPFDLRKAQPYETYNKIPFKVAVGTRGDCYDRYLIRMQEMRQSSRILLFALTNLPKGPIKSEDKKFVAPLR